MTSKSRPRRSTMDRIAYDSERGAWYLLRDGRTVARSVHRETLERKFPGVEVEERNEEAQPDP